MTDYLQKRAIFPAQIKVPPAKDLGIIVVIPCYDESDLIKSLEALLQADLPSCQVEVIIVINGSEKDEDAVKESNYATFLETIRWAEKKSVPQLQFHILYHPNLPAKKAGVGLARKIGMDEAVFRFESLEQADGIILCFDADSLCERNYFKAVATHFQDTPETQAGTIYFEHPLEGVDYSTAVYESIIQYELHLRYYINAKRFAGFPFAFQTIGSAMAVRSKAYQKQGGMNQRKAGEDFYFLNKYMHPGWFSEIKSTKVIPSPRVSHRVPFGTGKAISELLDSGTGLTTYNPLVFMDLKVFLEKVPDLYVTGKTAIPALISKLPESVQSFLKQQNFATKLFEIQSNTSNPESFENRFYQWFTPFLLMKFVHHARDLFFPNVAVDEAAGWLLETFFGQEDAVHLTAKEMLNRLRKADRK